MMGNHRVSERRPFFDFEFQSDGREFEHFPSKRIGRIQYLDLSFNRCSMRTRMCANYEWVLANKPNKIEKNIATSSSARRWLAVHSTWLFMEDRVSPCMRDGKKNWWRIFLSARIDSAPYSQQEKENQRFSPEHFTEVSSMRTDSFFEPKNIGRMFLRIAIPGAIGMLARAITQVDQWNERDCPCRIPAERILESNQRERMPILLMSYCVLLMSYSLIC